MSIDNRSHRCLGLIAALALLLSPCADAAEVIIVPSSNAKPYLRATQAIQEKLHRTGHKIDIIPLSEVQQRFPAAQDESRVFVAVGSQSAKWLHPNVKSPQHLVYCMVADPQKQYPAFYGYLGPQQHIARPGPLGKPT